MICPHCNSAVADNVNFCPFCGSALSGPVNLEAVFNKRAGSTAVEKAFGELRQLGWKTIVPWNEWLIDRPWSLLWVRWFALLAMFPLILGVALGNGQTNFASVAFLFGAYFAVIWSVVLFFMLRPHVQMGAIVATVAFTMVVGVPLDLLMQTAPLFRPLYAAASAVGVSLATRWGGFILGVGILEETVKILPVWWRFRHHPKDTDVSTVVFLGCISGFSFGVAEAVTYSLMYAIRLQHGDLAFGSYLLAQLTRLITLPLLHAIWTGTFAYFIGLGVSNPSLSRGLFLGGLLFVAVMHGSYDTLANAYPTAGLFVALLSLVAFVGYYRGTPHIQARLSAIAEKNRPKISVAGSAG